MLELVKKNIHMNRFKNNVATQVTLDDDFIVPDTMDDMARVILSSGDIQIESVKNQGERVLVKGKLNFQILYRKAEGGFQTMAGHISFEEPVNIPGLEEKDYLGISWDLEDLTASMINSRKVSVKAIVTLVIRVETLYDAEAAVDVIEGGGSRREDNSWGTGDMDSGSWGMGYDSEIRNGEKEALGLPADEASGGMEILRRQADVAVIAVRRKDTYRIKEDISLSGSKPSIEQILWSEIRLRGTTTKPLDGRIHIEGEVMIFAIYTGEGENTPVQWLEESIPFTGDVELPESVEGMVPSISVRLVHRELEAKPDYDGEMREFNGDVVLDLDIRLYQEEKASLLGDIYSTREELLPITQSARFQQILAKNACKCKVAEKITLNEDRSVLQICRSDGAVKLDEVSVQEDGLLLEGVLEVSLLYLTSDDSASIQAESFTLPFQCSAAVAGVTQESIYQVIPGLEQMTAVMMGGNGVEIKASIDLEILVQEPLEQPVITGVERHPLDMEKLQALPGIVGYIVQPEDDLWKIAKKFHTTMDTVMRANELAEETVKPGQKLILVKEIGNMHGSLRS